MSRIGKQELAIPSGTTVRVEENRVIVNGPKGELARTLRPDVAVSVGGDVVTLTPTKKTKFANALWGTYASHIANMLSGVNAPYEKVLIIEGVGFKAVVHGSELVLSLGFSHPVKLTIPEGIAVAVEKERITITGIDKELVGHFTAKIRAQKKPEPFKGKGIRYENEVIRRKAGKKAVSSAA
ncbi:50S ribosomal protein L6 [Candidatus Wolfebacteria bacterium]|nr:50S ribosomal protein L6 [Candidatus Wolfebacteria bacterium]